MRDIPIVTSTETSTIASDDVVPLAEPPVVTRAESRRDITEYKDEDTKMAQRLPLGGVLEASDALRMVGMIRNLPLQFVGSSDRTYRDIPCNEDDGSPEHRTRCGKSSNSNSTTALSKSGDGMTIDDGLDEEEDFNVKPDLENRRRKKPKRPSTVVPIRGTTSSCCKQAGGGDEENMLRRETARVNLDVLRRLSSMLNEEREKFAAERQMLGASRDMMMAEIRRVNSERGKIDSERQKVDLERDLLQSQMLGRRSPRFDHIPEPA